VVSTVEEKYLSPRLGALQKAETARYRKTPQIIYILTTDPDLISQVNVGDPIGISDHCRITFDIQVLGPVYRKRIKYLI
jgi:hypothetical protein